MRKPKEGRMRIEHLETGDVKFYTLGEPLRSHGRLYWEALDENGLVCTQIPQFNVERGPMITGGNRYSWEG